MSVRGPALRNTDLRSRHAYMRLAVAHATIPPRRTAPTRPGRHRPGWAAGRAGSVRGRPSGVQAAAHRLRRRPCGPAWTPEPLRPPGHETRTGPRPAPADPARPAAAARVHPAGTGSPAGKWTARKNAHGKRTLSDQPPGDLQKLDRAVSYEESWGLCDRLIYAS